MLEQLDMKLKGRSWVLMLPLIAVVALAACGPAPTPEVVEKVVEKEVAVEVTRVVEKEVEVVVEVTRVVEKEVEVVKEVVVTPTPLPLPEGDETVEPVGETKVEVLELANVIETPVPVEVKNRQPLQLDVIEAQTGRLHFRLEIDTDDYPPPSFGDVFTLTVTAIPTGTIAANFEACQEKPEECKYPEVVGLTDERRLIILVDSTEYVAANPYAFSVTGITEFANPVSVSISVDIPSEEIPEDHGIIIYHEDDGTSEHFSARLDEDDSGFLLVTNSDPITRCCKAYARCSSGPACLTGE
ncbi:MAG: hypothetical protein GTN71_14715 [Anaerolineae bacterium]|nr:hypothetical protein [Anaerolineae bacterium]